MLTHIPDWKERGPKAQPPIGIASERQPFQGSAKIIVFYLEQTHPFARAGSAASDADSSASTRQYAA